MGSTRLPGKVLQPILGEPMLKRMLERVQRAKKLDAIVVATTDTSADDATEELAKSVGVGVFRGSEHDVLDRYYRAAKEAGAEVVVRLTGDCPLMDPAVIDELVEHFDARSFEYSGMPENYPEGLDAEIFTFAALETAAHNATLPSEREHVSPYIKNHPELFSIEPRWVSGARDDREMHWSVDTQADFNFVVKIFETLYPKNSYFTKDDVLHLLDERSELLEINKGGTGYEGLAKSLKEDEVFKKRMKNKFVLGTAQMGMKYGLANSHGQPTQEEAFAILDAALAGGIDTFDTAWAYGTAEDVFGAWIRARSLAGKVQVISKMKPHAVNDYPDGTKASEVVRAELENSLARLNLDSLDGYLFHSPHYIYMSHMVEAMRQMQKEGRVKHIGVSVYNEPEALQAAELGVDYVQVPYNVFDQRLDKTNFFELAEKNQVTVFARSPFLQGLLLMQPNELPTHLAYLRPHLEQFIEIAKRYHLTQAEAALQFSATSARAPYVVFGVEEVEQLTQNFAMSHEASATFIIEIQNAFSILNHGAINPSLWSKIKL